MCRANVMQSSQQMSFSISGRGVLSTKDPFYGDVPLTWVAKSASWYMNDPLLNAKSGI